MSKLFVIFINYNSGNQLFKGLTSVLKSPSVAGVIIVDNGSKDNSMEMIGKVIKRKKVHIIRNKTNSGFYKALNIAIKKALSLNADAVMPLDYDLDFTYDFISKLSKIDGDIIVPTLRSKLANGWVYDYGGRLRFASGTSCHILLEKRLKESGTTQTSLSHDNPYWIDFVSGGCTIIKKGVIDRIGFFDEEYFVYWGDADYTYNALKNGFRVVLDRDTIVHHRIELASNTKNFRKLKISLKDNLTFIRKRVKWYFMPISYLNVFLLVIKTFIRTLK